MRKIRFKTSAKFILLGLLLAFNSSSNAQSDFVLVPEAKLMYEVTMDDKIYWFSVDVIKLENGISFSWSMSPPVNKVGYITLSTNALKNATKYLNNFTAGTKDLETESSVFLSDTNFDELVKKGSTQMDMGDGNSGKWKNAGKDNYNFTWMGSEINPSAYYLILENGTADSRSMVVLADGPYHLILNMNLGWKFQLKEVI